MKIQINIEKRHLLLLVAVIAVAAVGIVLAAKPNPGHSLSEIDITLDCITVSNSRTTASGFTSVDATLPAGYNMTGGGCTDSTTGSGRLLVRNGPSGTDKWFCADKDQMMSDTGTTLTAYVIGCKLK